MPSTTFARLLVAAAVLAATGLTVAPTAMADVDVDCSDFATPIQRLVKPATGTNLLTRWESEAQSAARYGFSDNGGVIASTAGQDGPGLAPVWRLYKSGDFAWALDGEAADQLVEDGYDKQFVAFYAASDKSGCLDAVYQVERDGVHRIALADELSALDDDGWENPRVAFYAVLPESSTPGPAAPQVDTKFSIAVIPDTQNEVLGTSTRFANRVSWLVDNKDDLDLRFALQVGDLTNWGNVDPAQFDRVSSQIKPLEAAVPWAGAIGNHDSAAVCPGGSACPNTSAAVGLRNTSAYNKAFPTSRFPQLEGTFESGKIDNSFQTFSAGDADWLVLTLELWPRASVVSWAKQVVATHPENNVIVQTHAYLNSDGSISSSQGGYGSTSPQYLYDNVIKQYPNVKLVLSGHVGNSAVRTDTGVQGNKIVSLLQTFHSPTNPTRLVEIDTAGGSMTSKVYAPATDTDYPSYSTSTTGPEVHPVDRGSRIEGRPGSGGQAPVLGFSRGGRSAVLSSQLARWGESRIGASTHRAQLGTSAAGRTMSPTFVGAYLTARVLL